MATAACNYTADLSWCTAVEIAKRLPSELHWQVASGERPRQAANKGLAPHSTHANAIMPSMRTFDAFLKPVEGTRAMSWQGGLITIIASASAAFLFLSQLYLYFAGDVRHSLHLAESNVASSLMRAVPEKLSLIHI